LTLDLVVVAGLLLAALLGAASGALRQTLQLGAALLGWVASRHLSGAVASGLGRWLPGFAARPAAAALLFFGTFALVSLVGGAILRARGLSRAVRSPADRGLGALLGGAKGALIAWVLLSALALAGGPVGPARFRLDPRASDFGRLAREHNLLVRVDPAGARRIERVLEILRDPGASRLGADPDGRRLLQDPRLRALGGDAATRDAAAERIAADPELRALVDRLLERDAAVER
jgi:membrane protein required for colicin V production